jgi:two-component system sensor histidine kinase AtoS
MSIQKNRMSKLTLLHQLSRTRRNGLEVSTMESLLNAIPHAAIIVNGTNQKILCANTRASEVTAYTRSELIDLPFQNIFLSSDDGVTHSFFEDNPSGEMQSSVGCDLLHHNGSRVAMLLAISRVAGIDNLYLVSLNSQEDLHRSTLSIKRQQTAWSELINILTACAQSDQNTGLLNILSASAALCGADVLCIYQAVGETPVMRQLAVLDPDAILPHEVFPQDLGRLKHSTLWLNGKRSTTDLHQQARAANLNFMATAPIGGVNTMMGLFTVAGRTNPPDSIKDIVQFLADLVYFHIQSRILQSTFQDDIATLQLSQLASETVFDTIEDGLTFLTPDLDITRMNTAAEIALGYRSEEVYGQSIKNVLICNENLETSFRFAQEDLRPSSIAGVRIYRRNGDLFLANLRVLPIATATGLHSILIILHDLSEQEEYKTRNQQLEQRATLADITASFAHEVRNPINNISTGLQLLALNLPEEDPNQENISRLQNDCERLADLVKSGLSFVRPVEYKLEPVDLGRVISNLMDRWRNRLNRTQVKYNPQIEPNVPTVEGDLRALEQVFTNLIDNAIQAMESGGGILTINLRHVPDAAGRSHVEINILDTGPGIPHEAKEHIFEPFYTTKRNGTGLGLAIVKRIVTAHKGSIHVSSIPGGTMFQVRIPCN